MSQISSTRNGVGGSRAGLAAVAATAGAALLVFLAAGSGEQETDEELDDIAASASAAGGRSSSSHPRSLRKLRAARSMLSEGLISHMEFDRVKVAILEDLSGGRSGGAVLADELAEIRGGLISAPPSRIPSSRGGGSNSGRVSPPLLAAPIARAWRRSAPLPPPIEPVATAMIVVGLGLLVAILLMSVAASLRSGGGVNLSALLTPAILAAGGAYWSVQSKKQSAAAMRRGVRLSRRPPAAHGAASAATSASGRVAAAVPTAPVPPPVDAQGQGAEPDGGGGGGGGGDTAAPAVDLDACDAMNERREHDAVVAALQPSADDALTAPSLLVDALWRLARAKLGLAGGEPEGGASRFAHQDEAKADAERALALSEAANAPSGQSHKWLAIATIKIAKEQGGTTEAIKASSVYKEHISRAIELSPGDANAHSLLGMWCYHVAAISWFERRAASMIFAVVPTATYDDALRHLLKAEELEPGAWSSSQLYIARCYYGKGEIALAKTWCQRACDTARPDLDPDEQVTKTEAVQLLAKLR